MGVVDQEVKHAFLFAPSLHVLALYPLIGVAEHFLPDFLLEGPLPVRELHLFAMVEVLYVAKEVDEELGEPLWSEEVLHLQVLFLSGNVGAVE